MERIEDRVFKRFNEIFEEVLTTDKESRRHDQFDAASQEFRQTCGFEAYPNYESFKSARNRRRSRVHSRED